MDNTYITNGLYIDNTVNKKLVKLVSNKSVYISHFIHGSIIIK